MLKRCLWTKKCGNNFPKTLVKIFLSQAKHNVEAYVDEILVQAALGEDHFKDLEETFRNIKRVGLRIKGKKCTSERQKGTSLAITSH